jgi:L-malate glycosyltransferase
LKKNVLQLIGSFNVGGSERQAVQLTKLLHEDGSVNVFVATLDNEGVLRRELTEIGYTTIPEFRLSSFYDLNFFRQLKRCVSFIRANKIDVVHTTDFYTNVFGISAAFIANVKVRIASKRETGGNRTKFQELVERFAFRRVSSIIVNSSAVKRHLLEKRVSSKKITVIHNGLDLERLTPILKSKREIFEALGIEFVEDLRLITIVANLRHEIKNIPMFLRVGKKICENHSNVKFVIAGEGELLADLKVYAESLSIANRVEFIGHCDIVPELLSVSYICCLTSFSEGFSNSIIEYMSASKPVIATNVGGASEAISEGESGYLVESDDDVTMASRINELLNDEEKTRQFGEKGREIAVLKFSLAAQLKKTLELYEQ